MPSISDDRQLREVRLALRPYRWAFWLFFTTACGANTQADWFWTSSPDAWGRAKFYVFFTYGDMDYLNVDRDLSVRCVRSETVLPCESASRFVVIDDGLVRDTFTGLVWQQQGSTKALNWAEAQSYCPSDLRLPTVKELRSIVKYSVSGGGPTIDLVAFPNTPSSEYWTSTLVADYPPFRCGTSTSTSPTRASRTSTTNSETAWAGCVVFAEGNLMNAIASMLDKAARTRVSA